MRTLFNLGVAVAASAAVAISAPTQANACEATEWGFGYIRVADKDESWTYALKSAGPNWVSEPYGWHATGALHCQACPAFGLYHLRSQPGLDPYMELRRPTTAAARIERRTESFGYPPLRLGPTDLMYVSSRENLSVGPVSGYAVQYRELAKGPDGQPKAPGDLNVAILVISLADHCVVFDTTISVRVDDKQAELAALDSLLREVSIERIRSELADPPTAVRVRPKRDQGVPSSAPKLKSLERQ
jgi:hypothetical protein